MTKRNKRTLTYIGLAFAVVLFCLGLTALAAVDSTPAITSLWGGFLMFGLISFDIIPGSIRKPGQYIEFNTRTAMRGLPQNKLNLLLIGQRLKAFIEPARFQGGTLNNCTSGGTFTGSLKKGFTIKITTAAATDKFKYSTDGGATWSAETNLTGAAQTLEDGVTITFGAITGHAVGDEWRFGAWPEPSVAEKVPTEVFSDAEVADKFGFGSVVHSMATAAYRANRYLELHVCALDDAATAVQSSGAATITGTATASGSMKLYVGNKKIEVGVAKDDTAASVAIDLQNESVKYTELPVSVQVDPATPGKLLFKAKNKGLIGNQIGIGYECDAKGVTVAITAMTGGATDPNINDALTPCATTQYDNIAVAYNDATSLQALRTHLDFVSGAVEQRPGVGVFGFSGAIADGVTLAGQINAGRIVPAYTRFSATSKRQYLPYENAAADGAILAFEEDPARPLNGLPVVGMPAPHINDALTRTEQETCLYNGLTPHEAGKDGIVRIVRMVTSYTKNAMGVDDPALLDITTIRSLDYIRKAIRTRIALRFPREKLLSRVKDAVWAEVYDVLKLLEELEIVENVDANIDGIKVENNIQDPNRLDVVIPADIVNGLHVFAARIDLIL